MSLVVNNNIMAIGAARNLNTAYGKLGISTERLSSGLRVNSSSDDAAGLAVRELMRADISTINQGVRNANDGISMIQTADGALSVIDEKLIRMKELAEQAATGTYTDAQRSIINDEYQAMASEITRIASATDFNGIYLLNGNLSEEGITIHFGTGNDAAEDKYSNQHRQLHRIFTGCRHRLFQRHQFRWRCRIHPGISPGRPGCPEYGHHVQGQHPRQPRLHAEQALGHCLQP